MGREDGGEVEKGASGQSRGNGSKMSGWHTSEERQLTEGEVDALTSVCSRMHPRASHVIGITEVAPWACAHVDATG